MRIKIARPESIPVYERVHVTKAPGMKKPEMHADPDPPRAQGKAGHGRTAALGTLAGVWGGTVATLLQLLAWWAGGQAAFDLLLRDTRAAAALLLGTGVLSATGGWDVAVLAAATTVHLFLCAAYGWLLGALLVRHRRLPPLPTGLAFGALLFAVNMYGFTAVFPWFAANRDWATFLAHLGFGIETARAWRWLHSRF